MDPLSLTASILAVVGAGARLAQGLDKLIALRGAPDELLALNNEVSDLRLVLSKLQDTEYEEHWEASSAANLLTRARRKLLEVEELIEYRLTTVDRLTGESKIDWVGWLRERSQVLRLQRDIKTIKNSLSTSLTIGLYAEQRSTQLQVLTIAAATSRQEESINTFIQESQVWTAQAMYQLQQAFAQVDLRMEKQTQMYNDLCNAQLALSDPKSSQSALEEGLPTTKSTRSPSRNLKPNGFDYSAAACPQSSMPFSVTQRRRCARLCSCSCHKQRSVRSPKMFEQVFGRLFLGYSGLSSPFQGCNDSECRARRTPYVRATFAFPRWFMARAVLMTTAYTRNYGPELCLRVLRGRSVSLDGGALYFATTGDTEAVKRELTEGTSSVLDIRAQNGRSALHYAVYYGHPDTVRLLLSAGADLTQEDFNGFNSYDLVCQRLIGIRRDDLREELLKIFNADEVIESQGFPNLHQIIFGFITYSLVAELESPLAAVNGVDRTGRTALSWAAQRGDIEALQHLINHNANPNIKDLRGRTPLFYANDASCLIALLHAGADVYHRDLHGNTPVLCAAYRYQNLTDVLEVLVRFGANLRDKDTAGDTVPHNAVYGNSVQVFKWLLQRSEIDINAPGFEGRTALMVAISWNRHDVLELLFNHEPTDYLMKDHNGESLLHYAANQGDLATLQLLQRAELRGLDTQAVNSRGFRPLDIALRRKAQTNPQWLAAFTELLGSIQALNLQHGSEEVRVRDCASWKKGLTFCIATELDSDEEEEDWEDALEQQLRLTTLKATNIPLTAACPLTRLTPFHVPEGIQAVV